MIASQVYMLIEHFVLDNKRHPNAILLPEKMQDDLRKEYIKILASMPISEVLEFPEKTFLYGFPVYFCTNITEIKLL